MYRYMIWYTSTGVSKMKKKKVQWRKRRKEEKRRVRKKRWQRKGKQEEKVMVEEGRRGSCDGREERRKPLGEVSGGECKD